MHLAPPASSSHGRRLIRGAAVAALGLALTLVAGPAAAPIQAAQAPPASAVSAGLRVPVGSGRVAEAARAAGAEFGVPPALLLAVSLVESGWEGRGGTPNEYEQYGVMGLRMPPGGETLAQAAALLGSDPAVLARDDVTNIRGAAALLRKLAAATPRATAQDLAPWYPVVARYSAIPDDRVARSYAYSVFQALQAGATRTTAAGETITLPGAGKLALPDQADPLAESPDSDDYPIAHWVAANANNYQLNRQYGPLNFVIIHDIEGSYQSAISWFQNPASGVSAHFILRSSDGDITQMVHNADTGYHAGNWDYNVRSIGVEHEGYMNQQGWYTQAMYAASATMVRTFADRFSIRKDHAHVIGHYQVPNQANGHTDPGPNWDWAGYMARVRNDGAVVARIDNTDGGFAASPGIIDPAHGWTIYTGAGWNGSNSYRALSTTGAATNAATWSATLPGSGLYDVYAFIPWIDNGRAESRGARYTVATTGGAVTVTVDQKALTDAGILQNGNTQGEWAHLGRFNLNSATNVSLNNATSTDSALNVWFDAVMWIPAGSVASPTPVPPTPSTATRTPTRTPTWTPTWTPTNTPIPTDTWTPLPTDTPLPTNTPLPTWTPGPCGMRFIDLPETDWAYAYVANLYCQGIISGYADGTFRGGSSATRGQLAKMVTLGMGWSLVTPSVPTFSDVPLDAPYFVFVETAYAHGVVSGYADGTFRPYTTITRAQLSKMITLAKAWAPLAPDPPSFLDVPADYWAFGFIEAVRAHGVVGGYADGTFRPGKEATRSQLSRMLSTALQQPDGTPLPTWTPTVVVTGTPTEVTPTVAPTYRPTEGLPPRP
ncbi:MAG TPA: S-layer homology domain-containing protein [Chloroflexia bacterium]|nr:S-layer homology domain-containing protein [Chloroflexia bacterium]